MEEWAEDARSQEGGTRKTGEGRHQKVHIKTVQHTHQSNFRAKAHVCRLKELRRTRAKEDESKKEINIPGIVRVYVSTATLLLIYFQGSRFDSVVSAEVKLACSHNKTFHRQIQHSSRT